MLAGVRHWTHAISKAECRTLRRDPFLYSCLSHMSFVSYALISVPDLAAGRRLHGFSDDLSDKDVLRAMEHIGKQKDCEGAGRHALRRIVAVSLAVSDTDGFALHSLNADELGEQAMLAQFFQLAGTEFDSLVSWDGEGTVVPVLHARAMHHGIAAREYWRGLREGRHVHLVDELVNHGSAGRNAQQEFASLMGLPVVGDLPEMEVDLDMDVIQAWCDRQSISVACLHLRYQMISGAMSVSDYQSRMDLMAEQLCSWKDAHLKDFSRALSADT